MSLWKHIYKNIEYPKINPSEADLLWHVVILKKTSVVVAELR